MNLNSFKFENKLKKLEAKTNSFEKISNVLILLILFMYTFKVHLKNDLLATLEAKRLEKQWIDKY